MAGNISLAKISVNLKIDPRWMEAATSLRHDSRMKGTPYRKRAAKRQPRHFIQEWRVYRGLTQERLGEIVGRSPATISAIENGKPYNQELLEAFADALRTDPASLIMRNPLDPEGIWSVWETVPTSERPRVIQIIKTFSKTGTNS